MDHSGNQKEIVKANIKAGAPNGRKYVSARVDGSYRAYGIIRKNGVIEWVGINNQDYKAVIRELNAAY